MWPLAVLTGDRINERFFNKKLYDRFAGPKKSGRKTEVTVRLGSTLFEVFKLLLPFEIIFLLCKNDKIYIV